MSFIFLIIFILIWKQDSNENYSIGVLLALSCAVITAANIIITAKVISIVNKLRIASNFTQPVKSQFPYIELILTTVRIWCSNQLATILCWSFCVHCCIFRWAFRWKWSFLHPGNCWYSTKRMDAVLRHLVLRQENQYDWIFVY